MTINEVKDLQIGQFLHHEISENYVQIMDISWKSAKSNLDKIQDLGIRTKDFVQDCDWTITEEYLENYQPAPVDFDSESYIKACQEQRRCKCCGVSEGENNSIDENGICDYCNRQKKLIETDVRKTAFVDLGEFDVLGSKGDYMELTEWTNGEGYDLFIHKSNKEEYLQFTDEELLALFNLATSIGFSFYDLSKI